MNITFAPTRSATDSGASSYDRFAIDGEACVRLPEANAFGLTGEMIRKVTGEPMRCRGCIPPERVGVFIQHLHREICVAHWTHSGGEDKVRALHQLERVAQIAYREEAAVSWC